MNEVSRTIGITIVGLGTGPMAQLTQAASDWLARASQIAVRARNHPALQDFPNERLVVLSMKEPENGQKPNWVQDLTTQLLDLGRTSEGVTYAAPGNPLQDDVVAATLVAAAAQAGLPVQIIPGINLAGSYLEIPPGNSSGLSVTCDALQLARLHTPPFPPTATAYITQFDSQQVAEAVQAALAHVYPQDWQLWWAAPDAAARPVRLADLTLQGDYSPYTVISIPPLPSGTSMEDFEEIIAHLRTPYGCPWDRQQTHLSLRKHLLEEAYEAIEALDAQDVNGMVEEFGDLLLQIVLHAEIATESGEFRMADVIQGIYDKIIRRHPHVFGNVQVEGVGGVLVNWEKLKAAERESNGEENGKKGLLDGVPAIFPALAQAHEIQDRAARVGFDWMDVQGVIEKVKEEIEEVESAPDQDSKTAEIGDLLFALVNLARWEKVDAEAALRAANARFRKRFGYIEAAARKRGITVNEMSVEEMNRLWDEAKEKRI